MSLNPISHSEPTRPPVTWKLALTAPLVAKASDLDSSQQHVVDHRHGALLVLAGPGTGKTTTLTEAVVARMTEGVRAENILVLTFARKAAAEIRDRIMQRVGGGSVPTVQTFHSLALTLLRELDPAAAGDVRLLSAPEQEVVVREILQTLIDEPQVAAKIFWPATLAEALGTRGMTVEIRNALARARSLGLDPHELAKIAHASWNKEWLAVSQLLEEYLESVEQTTAVDYTELIFKAVALTQSDEIKRKLHERYHAIFVDEYQDTDPLQVQLLKNLVGANVCLVAVGDPDQSIYSFRGADTRAVRDFTKDFSYMSGIAKPEICALSTTRRFGPGIGEAVARVIARNDQTDFPADREKAKAHRHLKFEGTSQGEVVVEHFESADAEAEEIADQIRALVLNSRTPAAAAMAETKGEKHVPYKWSDVGVLVRSGTVTIPTLERALIQAGVPVAVSFDDVALASEPAVATLLLALEVAAKPFMLERAAVASALLASPLAGLEASDIRRIGRALRRADADHEGGPRWSEDLIAMTLANPKAAALLNVNELGAGASALVALSSLLADAIDLVKNGKSPEDILWHLWNGTSWPTRLRHRALSATGGSARAHRDLDSVITLFELAKTSQTRRHTRQSVTTFVQQIRSLVIPAQATQRSFEPDAVSLMTAHRSKGLEWRAVFVCGADEAAWPDVRRRNSIFEPDRLQHDSLGSIPERHEVVAEERRLFYVASTRAKEYLHVSTTAADADSGRLPSRFIKQLLDGQPAIVEKTEELKAAEAQAKDLVPRYSIHSLVSLLRRTATNSSVTPALRAEAETRLARLANLKDAEGRLLVPSAHPQSWWGIAPLTENAQPVDVVGEPVYIRGSSLQSLHDCALSWFMSQRVHAEEQTTAVLSFGSIVHALAEAVGLGTIQPNLPAIEAHLDQIWGQVKFETPWMTQRERTNALECMSRFLVWRQARERTTIGREVDFDGSWTVTSDDGVTDVVRLKGQIDIVEISDSNGILIVDLKTNQRAFTYQKALDHMQLGLYQAAVEQGLLNHLSADFPVQGEPAFADGASLVHLRVPEGVGKPTPAERPQLPLSPDPETNKVWIEDKLAVAAEIVRSEKFLPTLGDSCSYCRIKNSCPLQPQGRPVIS